ncbi:MAG TPA: hypothetical protein VFG77_02675 [Nitrososphaeraceae archaeon]|nr:hypothetical protein [Nitrososphaeraceae archaeon]
MATTTHWREFKDMQRKPIMRCCGLRRKENAMNHSLIPFNYPLGVFAPTAMLSTILKTPYHVKSNIVVPSCVPGSVTNITCD